MTASRMLRNALFMLVLLPVPTMASGRPAALPATLLVTVDQVIAMRKAGVSDAVILALIERDRPIFLIDGAQIVQLRTQGVSEPLLLTMLATGYYWQQAAPCGLGPIAAAPQAPTSTRGIFFTRPTRGMFFTQPPSRGCR